MTTPTKYNVFRHDRPGELIMTAPMATIWHAFALHADALRRLVDETTPVGGMCTIHFNGRAPRWCVGLSIDAIDVMVDGDEDYDTGGDVGSRVYDGT